MNNILQYPRMRRGNPEGCANTAAVAVSTL